MSKLGDWRGRLQSSWKLVRGSPTTLVGLILTLIVFALAGFAPLYAPFPGDAASLTHLSINYQPPSWTHLFGTDDPGRDVFRRTMIRGPLTLSLSLIVVLIAAS